MNLKKAMFWRQPGEFSTCSADGGPVPVPSAAQGKLTHDTIPGGYRSEEFVQAPVQPSRVKGLMNAPELEAFFSTNQFGFGRYQGSHYRTQEALDRGLLALVTNFQNIISDLVERRQARMDKLQRSRQDVATLSPALAETLRLACEQTQREIAVLTEQRTKAEQRKGWVLDALNRYQLGFDRGVREALEFELLNA